LQGSPLKKLIPYNTVPHHKNELLLLNFSQAYRIFRYEISGL
jgi:hypothetical protein